MKNGLSFLSDKFTPAALPEVYAPRRELLANLYAAAENGFISITAPAGSGKTVSALLWLLDSGRTPVWIGLDSYDNGMSMFYKLIATGLFSTQPDNANMRAILEDAAFSASPVEHTIALISEMRLDEAARALVLDDMHLVTNGEIAKSLPYVIRRLPQSFVTLALSRAELPKGLRSLIKSKDSYITSAHLRFTHNEIQAYFKSLGRSYTAEDIGVVRDATDGWAIGVNAIAQSGDFSIGQKGGVFAHFFEEHIWNTWDESLRDFCLRTSVVDEFDAALAELLSGREDAREITETLARANSFVSRLRNDTYRYHHLFMDFLRERRRFPEKDTAELYKTAANYYIDRKDYSMALRFWLDSGDYNGADKFLFMFMFNNHHGDIAGYVDFLRMYFIRDFSEEAFREFPALHVCCAWYYYMTSQYREYERHADEGYRHIMRIALYDPKFVEFAMLMYSVDHRSEMMDKIKRFGVFGRLVKHFSKDGIIRYIASCTHNLPFAHRSSFDYTEAVLTDENVEKIRRSPFNTLLGDQSEAVFALAVAGRCYEQNDLESALAEANRLSGLLNPKSSIELRVSAKFLMHSILHRIGRESEASAALTELSEFVRNSAQFFAANLEAYKVRMKLADGDRAAAQAWLDNYYVVDAERIDLYLLYQHFTTARAHLALGDFQNARRYILMLREFGSNLNRTCDFCEASALLAALEWAANNKKEAVAALEAALEKLQKYEYSRMVIDGGASLLPVLRRIAENVRQPDYSGRLERQFVNEILLETHRFAKKHVGVTARLTQAQKPVKLSAQQTRMLSLLSKGYSNAMIVAETGLKITTVKTHTAIAYEKLGVNNAVDAVLRARELGLIGGTTDA